MSSCAVAATSRTRVTCVLANSRFSGSTNPALMNACVFFAQRQGLAAFTRPHWSCMKLVQVASGTRELLAEVVAAHLQELAADGVGHAEDLAEHVDQPLLAVEAEQHAGRAADSRFVDQQLHVGRHGVRVGQVQVGRCPGPGRTPRTCSRRSRHAALHVQHVVDDDAVEPGAELALALERRAGWSAA